MACNPNALAFAVNASCSTKGQEQASVQPLPETDAANLYNFYVGLNWVLNVQIRQHIKLKPENSDVPQSYVLVDLPLCPNIPRIGPSTANSCFLVKVSNSKWSLAA